jgi:CheY-like chemotaxis protein
MGRLTATGDLAFRWGRAATLVTSVVLGSLTASLPAHAETFVSIGSGEMDGVYYPVAQAICEVIGRELRAQDIWCSAEATPGSVYNVDAVLSGELEFGIVQSDVQFAAYKRVGAWRDKEASQLRSVLEEFLASLRETTPSCVLMDQHMPSLNGLDVMLRMRSEGRHVPVIIVTGFDQPGLRERCLDAGASEYIVKPLAASAVSAAIQAAVAA